MGDHRGRPPLARAMRAGNVPTKIRAAHGLLPDVPSPPATVRACMPQSPLPRLRRPSRHLCLACFRSPVSRAGLRLPICILRLVRTLVLRTGHDKSAPNWGPRFQRCRATEREKTSLLSRVSNMAAQSLNLQRSRSVTLTLITRQPSTTSGDSWSLELCALWVNGFWFRVELS